METIIVIILVLLLLPRILRWWLRWWIGRHLSVAAQGKRKNPKQKQRPEGDVCVEGEGAQGRVRGDVGEYVEFEEIKD